MPDLFADTSFWGNLIDPTQNYHTLAATLYRAVRQQQRQVIITNYIITTQARQILGWIPRYHWRA